MFRTRLIGEAIVFCAAALAWGVWTAAIVGCSESASSKLVGTWERPGVDGSPPVRIVLDAHGNMSNNDTGTQMMAGKWSATASTITIDSLIMPPFTADISFDGRDSFTITAAGEVTTFRRVLDPPAK